MKNLVLIFTAMILGTSGVFATGINEDKVATRNAYRYDNSFIFVENGITFSVYPDGEFDFYIENQVTGIRNGITFNSGFDYSPYAQYDDYGAVIQVENVPVYYDYYGRVNQIGSVDINYVNRRVRRIGGMSVFYNNRGFYDYHTGYINIYNRSYVYRPFHRWFSRPAINLCLVYNSPYRRYYTPIRYSYYNPYRNNFRKAYVNVGRPHRFNEVRHERDRIYRNDKRVAARDNSYRTNRNDVRRDNGLRTDKRVSSNSMARSNRSTHIGTNTSPGRSDRGTMVTKRGITRSSGNNGTVKRDNGQNRTVTKREVVSSPRSTTVKRSTTTYKKPVAQNSNTRSVQGRTQRGETARSTAKVPSRSERTVRSNDKSRSFSKAPSKGSRSVASRSTTTRSNGRN